VGFLETVIEAKRTEVAERSAARPVAELEQLAAGVPVRDFAAAISGGNRVIAELKARTPTIKSFRHSESLHDLARTYEEGGAAAISIVVDEANFGTSLDDVHRVRERVALPVLAKEFIFDPYQVLEARAFGADAILLIARMLDWDRLTGLLELTRRLGMAALVETHSEDEMKMALQAKAGIVGVNNRDLDTMTISLDTTRRLARLVPAGVTLVAESGIKGRADVEDLAAHGAGAFLVGGSLLDSPDPGRLLRQLTGEEPE
jgi:indole-3-glycerol phosphate synthase